MTERKKPWIEPELIVLVRNRPEEAVLGGCKRLEGGVGPYKEIIDCSINHIACVKCSAVDKS